MPKKTVDEFKRAFSAIKKPGRPKAVSRKLKGGLEKAVENEDETQFVQKLDEIAKLDPNYLVDLVAYKFGKHLDDGKMPTWHKKVPPDIRQKALAKIVPGDLTDDRTKRLMNQSIGKGDIGRMELLVERDPVNTQNFFSTFKERDLKYLLEHSVEASNKTVNSALIKQLYQRDPTATMEYILDEAEKAEKLRTEAREATDKASREGNTEVAEEQGAIRDKNRMRQSEFIEMLQTVSGQPNPAKFIAQYLMGAKTDKATAQLLPTLGNMPPADLEELALSDPTHFLEGVLPKLDSPTLLRLLTRPDLRDALEKAAPDQWEEFAEKIPMLRLYTSVEETRKDDTTTDKDAKQLGDTKAIFDTLMDGGGAPAAYIGTAVGNPSDILCKPGDPNLADPPRTDCHNMLMLLSNAIKGYPGLVPGIGEKLKHGSCTNMLMTKPLSEIGKPGRGLIDKSFTGNVFDDTGKATGRILFTGENGVNSHSWLEAGGQAFDPVLGISGSVDDVKNGATFQTFDWALEGQVGRGGDWYFIVDDENILKTKKRLGVAANKMSFSKAYILTKDPARHLKPEFAGKL